MAVEVERNEAATIPSITLLRDMMPKLVLVSIQTPDPILRRAIITRIVYLWIFTRSTMVPITG